jgi:exodeoxyribonuclease-3
MKVATFNVNGVKGRLPRLVEWLDETQPDIVCLQEIKTGDATFPALALEAAGYRSIWHGQKSHHGVAILARAGTVPEPVEVRRGLPGDGADLQARYLEADVGGLRVASVYLPNGNPAPGDKFDYKLAWFERLRAHARTLVDSGVPTILAGDFNVVPTDADIYTPPHSRPPALPPPETPQRPAAPPAHGWVAATLHQHPQQLIYTFWVKAEAHRRNAGFRMDFLLLSPSLLPRLREDGVDASHRGREKPSDHAPVWITLDDAA